MLLGLLSMHGLPFSAGSGCSSPAAASAAPAHVSSGMAPMVMAAPHQMANCVTVGPRRSVPPVLALAGVLVPLLVLVCRVAAGWRAHPVERPPPKAGLSLLLWVCVSRT